MRNGRKAAGWLTGGLLLLAVVLSDPHGTAAPDPPAHVPGEVLVSLRPGFSAAALAGSGFTAQAAATPGVLKIALAPNESVESALARLGLDPAVASAQPNYVYRATALPSDPLVASQYHLAIINGAAGFDLSQGETHLTIAVLDTGADTDHTDLAAKLKIIAGSDFIDTDSNPDDDSTVFASGHGTAVAGAAGAIWENGLFGAGVARYSRIVPVRVLNTSGSGTTDRIAAAINLAAADSTVRVINLSLGANISTDALMAAAIQSAANTGIIVVAAAGNSGSGTLLYPASDSNAVGVGSTTSSDALSSFSNTGAELDLVAPGSSIVTLAANNGSQTLSGTSLSAPIVAGAAALAYALRPTAGAAAMRAWLRAGTKDLGDPGWDPFYGYGRLDLVKLLRLAGSPVLYDTGTGVVLFDSFVASSTADTHNATVASGAGPAGTQGLLSLTASDSFSGYAIHRFNAATGVIEFYCHLSTIQNGATPILLTQAGDGTLAAGGLDLRLDADTKLVLRQGGVGTITSATRLRTGEWNHVAIEYGTGGGLALWVNGETTGTSIATAVSLATDSVTLGARRIASTEISALGRYARVRARSARAGFYPAAAKIHLTDVDDVAAASALAVEPASFAGQATTTGSLSVQWRTVSSDTRIATISIGIDADTRGANGTLVATGLVDDGEQTVDVTSALAVGDTRFVYVLADFGTETSVEYLGEAVTRAASSSPSGPIAIGSAPGGSGVCLALRAQTPGTWIALLRSLRDLLLATSARFFVSLVLA